MALKQTPDPASSDLLVVVPVEGMWLAISCGDLQGHCLVCAITHILRVEGWAPTSRRKTLLCDNLSEDSSTTQLKSSMHTLRNTQHATM